MLNSPNSSARVTAPMLGRALSTTPNAIEISPVTMYIARVPAVSPLPKAAKISAKPATNAQIATTSTSTSAHGLQARADEGVDREQDDQRGNGYARPGDGDDPDDDAQNAEQDQ